MKRILITGANSYIGTSFEKYLSQWPERYHVDTIDMIGGTWCDKDFSSYDVVFHVAGIAHTKETSKNADQYYAINRDLTVKVAEKAKTDGVMQFIFLSSMSVYGLEAGVIKKDTIPNPKSNYGKSKIQAEEGLLKIAAADFYVVIIRPPMVYGKGCKGNFQSIIKLVRIFPYFPQCKNQRSMIYIDNLCNFIKLLIDKKMIGIYYPQNKEYVNISKTAQIIAELIGKRLYLSSMAGVAISLLKPFLGIARKAFDSLVYSDTEDFDYCYCNVDFYESIKRSV